ncbi:hypothetical protein AB0H73_14900 [Streptomyces olivoreticuli]
MTSRSIRAFSDTIHICNECAQPAFKGEFGPEHFQEQWDGVHCPMFPLAGDLVTVSWDALSLGELKAKYPDTYPHL